MMSGGVLFAFRTFQLRVDRTRVTPLAAAGRYANTAPVTPSWQLVDHLMR